MRGVDMLPRCVRTHKIMHPDRGSVKRHLRALRRGRVDTPDDRAYVCPECRAWHVGHDRRSFQARIRRATRVGDAKARGGGGRR